MRHPLRYASGWIVAACLSVYLAAVAVASQNGEPDWWPYWWLCLLVAVALTSIMVWAFTWRDSRPHEEPDAKPIAAILTGVGPGRKTIRDVVPAKFGMADVEEGTAHPGVPTVATPSPEDEEAVYGHDGWQLGDMRANVRVGDLRLVVRYKTSQQMVGLLTPSRGGYKATHIQGGELGWYPTVGKAMTAIWDAD